MCESKHVCTYIIDEVREAESREQAEESWGSVWYGLWEWMGKGNECKLGFEYFVDSVEIWKAFLMDWKKTVPWLLHLSDLL